MKRLHVHVGVEDLAASIHFYSTLFAAEPTVTRPDYAKWMLDDPRVNFAISSGQGAGKGIEHLGIQAESAEELAEVYQRLKAADRPVLEEGATTCCYAKSEKSWIADPQGVVWETFHTTGEAVDYGQGPELGVLASDNAAEGACCAPDLAKREAACC
jgi:catechol 2,3-dioxygenase-like lactoylglutathione lyase family enzyme